jgi:hypothetical protein
MNISSIKKLASGAGLAVLGVAFLSCASCAKKTSGDLFGGVAGDSGTPVYASKNPSKNPPPPLPPVKDVWWSAKVPPSPTMLEPVSPPASDGGEVKVNRVTRVVYH